MGDDLLAAARRVGVQVADGVDLTVPTNASLLRWAIEQAVTNPGVAGCITTTQAGADALNPLDNVPYWR